MSLTTLTRWVKKRPIKWLLEIMVFVLVFMIARAWTQRSIIEGPVPAITGLTLEKEKIVLQEFQPRPYLLHVWASWCGICRFEQDSIEAISKDYPVISIAMQSGNDKEVKQYMQDNQLSFRVINDEDGGYAQMFGVTGVPASFVIDKEGNIAYSEVGYTSEWGLRFRLWLAQQGW